MSNTIGQIFLTTINVSKSSLIVLVCLLFFSALAAILYLADKYLKMKAKESGVSESSVSLLPDLKTFFGGGVPSYTEGKKVVALKKGFDLKIKGAAEATSEIEEKIASRYAIKPTDFRFMSPIPKVTVEIGQEIKAGQQLFFDKKNPDVKYASPVSGEVIEINRGAKRRIIEVVVLGDKKQSSIDYNSFDLKSSDRDSLVNYMLESGIWPVLNQRPYGVVADHTIVPRDIFVSTFNTAPLAPTSDAIVAGNESFITKGVEVLSKLTDGKVYLGVEANSTNVPLVDSVSVEAEKVYFKGVHPAGNVGVQIHHTKPISKGDVVWTVSLQELISIGKLFEKGVYDVSKVITIAGPAVSTPQYVKVAQGANIGDIVSGSISAPEENQSVRLISGDVFTGKAIDENGYLGYKDQQITALAEGDSYELFGWLLPVSPRPSISNTFPNFLFPNMDFEVNTNTHGEKRAFVVTGEYESVLPMDIYPQHLLKSILANDLERMEGLGIYEVLEEDLALCEFVCTSKQDVQNIITEGIETMVSQG